MDNAQIWREKARQSAAGEASDLKLPSGMVIKARRPGPSMLAGFGMLPMSLAVSKEEQAEMTGEQVAAFAEFLRDLLVYCVVEPAISLRPEAGQIHPRDIPNGDTNFILAWAMRGSEAARLDTFRPQSGNGKHRDGRARVSRKAVKSARN
ncbi:MAG TPA: hypothetical protein VHZ25_17760 [Acidobacteriaceae bacterium]|jgi:hypothetical protein|nr:hypothetical protein [Acidobacteriaceae bacterium]